MTQLPRLGLCCLFREEPIRYRTTTAKALEPLGRSEQLARLSALCLHNAEALAQALRTARQLQIHAYRIPSPLFPRVTHPEVGYALDELPDVAAIRRVLARVKRYRARHAIRLSFHPDQFVVLASPRPGVVVSARDELEYQGQLAQLVGADTINVHVGGGYGDKSAALARFARAFATLSWRVRRRLSVENDDTTYSVRDLLPLCEALRIPLVYDVHHHRCNPDGLSVSEATSACLETWDRVGREPYLHVSSPREGWGAKNPRPHADDIDPADFPAEWLELQATVDVEAKAKELAVLRLREDLSRRRGMQLVAAAGRQR
jgi:UV DNA damage endonuclease